MSAVAHECVGRWFEKIRNSSYSRFIRFYNLDRLVISKHSYFHLFYIAPDVRLLSDIILRSVIWLIYFIWAFYIFGNLNTIPPISETSCSSKNGCNCCISCSRWHFGCHPPFCHFLSFAFSPLYLPIYLSLALSLSQFTIYYYFSIIFC